MNPQIRLAKASRDIGPCGFDGPFWLAAHEMNAEREDLRGREVLDVAAMRSGPVPREADHAAMAMRHNSIASRMRSVTSSRDRACVWHPGNCGTEAMF